MASFNPTATVAGTAIAPGWGTAIGFGIDLLNYVTGTANENKADALDNESLLIQAKSDVTTLNTNVGLAKTNILSTEKTISAYESFLDAFPNYADLQKSSFEAQSRGEFKGLLNNYAMGNARAGATGRTGGSAGLLSAEDQSELVDYAGEDMNISTDDGGRYQMARDETYNNLTLQEQQARDQLGIYQSTLGNINDTLGMYETALTDAQNRVLTLEGKIADDLKSKPIADTGAGIDVHPDPDGGIILPVVTTVTPDTAQRKLAQEKLDKDLADALALAATMDEEDKRTRGRGRGDYGGDTNSGSQNNAGWNSNNR